MPYRKKLIEVALPLDVINKESAREKSIRHGHPSTLHLWWARRPLAACRAVLFASLVDDPGNDLPEEEAKVERDRLFGILEELVKWENSNDENVLGRARAEIMRSTGGNPPPVLDPFCGGGSIPLEAQRLGLEAVGSDLNPIAVLITKALIEIPPKFADQPPVNPESGAKIGSEGNWRGAQGLAEDVRYYGKWMREEAEKRIGHLYPKGPKGETVIAWLWARTVRCPNPACGATMPLVSSFWLSKKRGKKAWVEPVVNRETKEVRFEVEAGEGMPRDGTIKNRAATCLVCGEASRLSYVRAEAREGRMDVTPMAVVAEARRGRRYLHFSREHESIARNAKPDWQPEENVTAPSHDVDRLPMYGMYTWGEAFTSRQLVALTTFSDLVTEVRRSVLEDARTNGLADDDVGLNDGGKGARAYAEAVATYLAFLVDQLSNHQSSVTGWNSVNTQMRTVFARQAIPMVWDFAESNPFCESSGSYQNLFERLVKGFSALPAGPQGFAEQSDAATLGTMVASPLVSTDPPYYDNVGYADLSDFFYVWLRRSMSKIYPSLFGTLLAPKVRELVAAPHRFAGSRQQAQQFFEQGLRRVFDRIREEANPHYPVTVFYAFKQSESEGVGSGTILSSSTGWQTMLEGLLSAGFQITGTWPVRTEKAGRVLGNQTNALASSIVLVCRPRSAEAPLATRREFVRALRRELPEALSVMMAENVAPVDLAQATIGPGMAIYSRYSEVIEADGSPMQIRTALQIINGTLDEHLAEGDVDPYTRFALTWFEQRGMQNGPYGEAETIAAARGVSVRGVVDTGILEARTGKVRLLPRERLAKEWDPATNSRLTDWEIVQYLIRALETEGETGVARLLVRIGERGEGVRDLAYRLYGVCDRKKWAEEALVYNGLVTSWSEITRLAAENLSGTEAQNSFEL